MGRILIFFVIPILIGWAIDKAYKRDGPGWVVGFLIGALLYGAWLGLSGQGGPPP